MSRLRLGVVGCGGIADVMGWFARFNRKIMLSAACDISAERAQAYARRFNIPRTFTDYEQMLGQVELDALYLALPHHLHYGMIATAVAHNLPVFTEKPLTRTLAEGQRIARLAEEQGVKVGVNYQYRYDSGCHRMARAVQNGDLGAIHAARINVPWHRKASYFENAAWHGKMATAGGGTLITQGSHFLDVILWAMQGDRPKTAMGYIAQRNFGLANREQSATNDRHLMKIDVEDLAQGIVEMESGALMQISSSMVASSEQPVSIEMYGEKGTAVYSSDPLPHVQFRNVAVKAQKPPYRGVHALQRSLEGFRAWIVEGRPYLIPAHQALPALAVVEALYRSAASGKREKIEVYPAGN
jgi:UDP-N-acetyl-2-amino-2-deoxyglucuronate dehydrogenase